MSEEKKENIDLLEYRLNEIENLFKVNMEKISTKMDIILQEINKNVVAQSELKVKVEKLESEFNKLREEDEKIQKDITSLQVSVAEKLSWGASGGIISAVLIKLLGA